MKSISSSIIKRDITYKNKRSITILSKVLGKISSTRCNHENRWNKKYRKTVLVTNIVEKLVERGFDVVLLNTLLKGLIEGRDTWKHKEAGAQIVVGAGAETFLKIGEAMELDHIFNLMKL